MLAQYRAHGIRHLVALRGDLPSGAGDAGDFRYASELVAFIRRRPATGSTSTSPRIRNTTRRREAPQDDLAAFKRKVDAGADSAITQYFYNRRRVLALRRRVRARAGIDGADRARASCRSAASSKLARFSDACGAEIPRWIRRKLEGYGDDTASIRAFGLDVVTDLCAGLLARGAPGLHFYTLNQAALTTTIWQRLGI